MKRSYYFWVAAILAPLFGLLMLLLPTSALLGGILLVAADTLARTVLAPREIPLGILTALLGTPLLLLLIARRTRDA